MSTVTLFTAESTVRTAGDVNPNLSPLSGQRRNLLFDPRLHHTPEDLRPTFGDLGLTAAFHGKSRRSDIDVGFWNLPVSMGEEVCG